jgi:hypothetical protein
MAEPPRSASSASTCTSTNLLSAGHSFCATQQINLQQKKNHIGEDTEYRQRTYALQVGNQAGDEGVLEDNRLARRVRQVLQYERRDRP